MRSTIILRTWLKIDTEGFELPVILGASRFFEGAQKKLPFIIVEITPRAYRLMNRGINELYDIMKSYGYKSCAICGCHPVDIRKLTEPTNVLFKP